MSVKKEKTIRAEGRTLSVHSESYNSAEDVANDARRPIRHREYDMTKRDFGSGHYNFFGVNSYQEAFNLLKNGYQPAVDALKKELSLKSGERPRFSFSNEVAGFLPVVPLALQGVPKSMIDMRIKPIKTKVIDIYYDISVNCGVSQDTILNAGKKLLGTILALEQQGYRFNVYAIQGYYGGSYYDNALDFLCVKVKSSNSPLDLKRMSYPLTHPAFFRVIGFDWQGKSPVTRYLGSGKGMSFAHEFSQETCSTVVKEMFGNNSLYLSCEYIRNNCMSDDNKIKEVLVNAKSA